MALKKKYLNLEIFVVELIGTFILVVFATGSIVYDYQSGQNYGIVFYAISPFIALIIGVYSFGKISLAHFNPAVTIGYFITGHITKIQISYYFAAELIGAIMGSIFVINFIGTGGNLGANAPNYDFPLIQIFLVECLATGLLMVVIFTVVYKKGLRGFSGIAIGGIVGLDILLFSFISGASMNPARALAPVLFSGYWADLWLYWSAPFVGTTIVGFLFRRIFKK